jgi:sugar O-acyltransferase (sialic acid O-acetyltransferase NeuD family)
MLIVGARGCAKEVLEILYQNQYELEKIVFFDNINKDVPEMLYGRFAVLKTERQVRTFFESTEPNFALGIGGPVIRSKLNSLFIEWGGKLTSTISRMALIGHFGVTLQQGVNIMAGSIITNDVCLGEGCLVNPNCTISHDCQVGNFVEMSPGVNIAGNCTIGDYCHIGTNATIIPKITLGQNVIVGAGAVVIRDVPSNSLVAGVPAKVIRQLAAIETR